VNKLIVVGVGLLLMTSLGWSEPAKIVVRGLFDKAVLLEIDGRQKLLRNGQRDSSGIELISATPMQALVNINGKRQVLTLNKQVGAVYDEAPLTTVVLRKNHRNEYRMKISINGRSVDAVVDTGASSMAMSSQEAERLGIAYGLGEPTAIATAGGMSSGYTISLNKVEVGGIAVPHVNAIVIQGDYPNVVLLGMSFLEHVNLQEHNNILTLSPRHH